MKLGKCPTCKGKGLKSHQELCNDCSGTGESVKMIGKDKFIQDTLVTAMHSSSVLEMEVQEDLHNKQDGRIGVNEPKRGKFWDLFKIR